MNYTLIDSPVGQLIVAGDERGLQYLEFFDATERYTIGADWVEDACPFVEVKRQLDAYFAGELSRFDLRLNPSGTDFQREVWQALQSIPYGETRSYAAIANAIDNPKAVRAVGAANGKNPIAIVVPCHRVIGRNGTLTGFGGGLPRKQFLLNLEGARQSELAL